jgi:hypothetical protein
MRFQKYTMLIQCSCLRYPILYHLMLGSVEYVYLAVLGTRAYHQEPVQSCRKRALMGNVSIHVTCATPVGTCRWLWDPEYSCAIMWSWEKKCKESAKKEIWLRWLDAGWRPRLRAWCKMRPSGSRPRASFCIMHSVRVFTLYIRTPSGHWSDQGES